MMANEGVTGLLAIGKDIRRLGSGNMGASNTWREIGPAAGVDCSEDRIVRSA